MTQQQADPVQQGLSYMRHQGAKSFGEIDAMLERTAGDWNQCLGSMTDEQATFRPEGEWCAKEVLGHVIVTERSINQDIASLAGIDPPAAPRVAEVRAMGVQSGDEESLPISELRERIVGTFAENRKLAASLEQSDKLETSFPHPIFGPLNLKEWLAFHRIHSMDHIQQIDKIKADTNYPSAWPLGFLARVYVTLKPTVNDPQGLTIKGALHSLGFAEVDSVRAGKYMELRLDAKNKKAAEKQVNEMCDKLLANPIIEEYRFEIAAAD